MDFIVELSAVLALKSHSLYVMNESLSQSHTIYIIRNEFFYYYYRAAV